MNLYASFTKFNEDEQMVYGYASTEALDSQGERVSKDAIADALPDYMKFANIREMHTNSAVGKAHEATMDDTGLFIGVKVIDPTAWAKVKAGVYNGFSIGGKKVLKIGDTITKMKLTEISLVDRPANPESVFQMFKGDDMEKEIEIVPVEEVEKSEAIEIAEVPPVEEIIEEIAPVVEEIEETVKSDNEDNDIEKAGAAISKTTKAKIEQIMKLCRDLIGEKAEEDAEDETTKSEEGSDLLKGEDMAKAFAIVNDDLVKANARIDELLAMPEAPKGVLMAIAKSEDGDVVVAKEAEPKTAFEAMKKAHAQPSFMKL